MRAAVVSIAFCAATIAAGGAGYMLGPRGADCALRIAPPSDDDVKYVAHHVERVLQRKTATEKAAPVVPTAEVAVAIHNAVCAAIFGKSEMAHEQPFTAIRCGDFWVIAGYLPPTSLGGVPVTVIRASNGEVIDIEAQE